MANPRRVHRNRMADLRSSLAQADTDEPGEKEHDDDQD